MPIDGGPPRTNRELLEYYRERLKSAQQPYERQIMEANIAAYEIRVKQQEAMRDA